MAHQTQLKGKLILKGRLRTLTGLHIGGSKSSLTIGGIDNNVVKSGKGQPYIPGSSLKGKLRSLLAKAHGSMYFDKKSQAEEGKKLKDKTDDKAIQYRNWLEGVKNDEDFPWLIDLFGYSGDNSSDDQESLEVPKFNYTRLLVRDSFLINEENEVFSEGYTQSKWENVIDRKTGTAQHPRQMERVPAGAEFGFELVYDIYNDALENDRAAMKTHLKALILALQLLGDDGLGGSISRGYGQVEVSSLDVKYKEINIVDFKYTSMEPLGGTNEVIGKLNNESGNA